MKLLQEKMEKYQYQMLKHKKIIEKKNFLVGEMEMGLFIIKIQTILIIGLILILIY